MTDMGLHIGIINHVRPCDCLPHSSQLDTLLCVCEAHFWMLTIVGSGFTLVETQCNEWGSVASLNIGHSGLYLH